MGALWASPTRSALASQDLDGLIRAYAAERGRPPLTETEVKAMRGIMDVLSNSQRMNKQVAKLRSLEDAELSEECTDAIVKYVGKIIKQLAKLAVDYAIECWWGGEDSAGCEETVEEIKTFNETVIKECKESGDLCTITQTHPKKDGGTDTESEAVCIPKECHDELEAAAPALAEQIQEKETKVASGNAGLGSHKLGKEDLDVDIKC